MLTVKVKAHQCLLDLSMQEKGSINTLFDFAAVNNISITDNLIAGQSMLIPDTEITEKNTYQYLRDNNIIPANAYTQEDEASIKGGISYMGVQIDFRIS